MGCMQHMQLVLHSCNAPPCLTNLHMVGGEEFPLEDDSGEKNVEHRNLLLGPKGQALVRASGCLGPGL